MRFSGRNLHGICYLYPFDNFRGMSSNIPSSSCKRVVIVGGGFGGLRLAECLSGDEFQIVLADRNNYHQFPPLFYQVATAGLEPSSILFPFRKVFQRKKNFYFRMAEVTGIEPERNRVRTTVGAIAYDYLVIAAGTTTNYFGNDALCRRSFSMKSVEEALAIRNVVLSNFERALTTDDPQEKEELLNVVVVGGGATGVEIAGALAEMKRFVLRKDYPDLEVDRLNIYLVEASSRLLGGMSPEASSGADRFLQQLGVKVLLDRRVTDYADDTVTLGDGSMIRSRTVIWVSGVTGYLFPGLDAAVLERGNRIAVDEFNRVKGYDRIFAIGDICYQTERNYPKGYPQVAQVAIQQGRHLAANLERSARGKPMTPFRYRNKGTMATVGRNRAVADLKIFKLQGALAWLIWLVVHLMSILGVRNRLIVLINWTWNYFTYDQSLRLILSAPKRGDRGKSCSGSES